MSLAAVTKWFEANWKGVLAISAIGLLTVTAGLTLHKFFGKPKGPGLGDPKTDPAELDRMTALYVQYKPALTKDELYYKSLADSIQAFMQTTTFLERDELYQTYFRELDTAGFVAVYYFWGPSREYTGSFFNNPFMGIDDRYGNLPEALKARCWTEDFQLIQKKFQSTSVI